MPDQENLLTLPPNAFILFLKQEGIRRFHFVYDMDAGQTRASHPALQPVADFLNQDQRDFSRHEGLFFQVTRQHDVLQGAFVHKTVRGHGAGGLRYWHYRTMEEFLRDGLRLSQGMTRKVALAGLWWGGGKGIMAENPALDKNDPVIRQDLYKAYGDLMTALRGCYVTAEDVGTTVTDIANVFSRTRFVTCIPPEIGGSGNPSGPTAHGVLRAMEAAASFVLGESLTGKTIAVQGLGNVGSVLAGLLFERKAKRVIASDMSESNVNAARERFAAHDFEARVVARGDNSILAEPCHIVAPCATGAVLNAVTIPTIQARIVCGAANNQLEDAKRDDALLQKHDVIYIPDFLVNRMGIVNCANEQYGYLENDPVIAQHLSEKWPHSVYASTMRVLRESAETGDPPGEVATRQADELSELPHPIFGHRGRQIIDSLVATRWFDK